MNMEEVEEKYKNRKSITLNIPKKFFTIWHQFLYLIEGDKEKANVKLQKPKEFRSFVLRRQVHKYVQDNWNRFIPADFEKWLENNVQDDPEDSEQ